MDVICISLMANDVENIFVCLVDICISALVTSCFIAFPFPFDICKICRDNYYFIPDTGNLCLLSFFFASLIMFVNLIAVFKEPDFY